MHRRVRHVLFGLFVILFFVVAPATVLYTAGYRVNYTQGRIVRTGVLGVTSVPRGADISIDGTPTGHQTPYVFNRMLPGQYRITLARAGYHDFTEEISVSSGKTAYLADVPLFPQGEPELLGEEPTGTLLPNHAGDAVATLRESSTFLEIWLTNLRSGTTIPLGQIPRTETETLDWYWTTDDRSLVLVDVANKRKISITRDGVTTEETWNPADETSGPVSIIRHSSAVEIRDARSNTSALVALLPLSSYTVREYTDPFAILENAVGTLTVLDLSSQQPLLLSTAADSYDWSESLRQLVWSDGIEVNTYNPATDTVTFITRQSERIQSVSWYPSGTAILLSTAGQLDVITMGKTGTTTTVLVDDMDLERTWLDPSGRAAYLVGYRNGIRGVYRLGLK